MGLLGDFRKLLNEQQVEFENYMKSAAQEFLSIPESGEALTSRHSMKPDTIGYRSSASKKDRWSNHPQYTERISYGDTHAKIFKRFKPEADKLKKKARNFSAEPNIGCSTEDFNDSKYRQQNGSSWGISETPINTTMHGKMASLKKAASFDGSKIGPPKHNLTTWIKAPTLPKVYESFFDKLAPVNPTELLFI